MVSIIIRTKNEERWITPCLKGVYSQDYKDFEVIIVDNESTDKTIEKASQFNIDEILTCKNYKPGFALNMGIRASKGEYIVCLSGHCVPVNEKWLSHLISNFDDKNVAGVYGRQEPLAFTPDSDKRDLSIIFGLDKKVQKNDSFFHNANSMIRRNLWEKIPFDEIITNIEDRLWAEMVLQEGYKVVYEPKASVFHYHGIHQNENVGRCINVVKILEGLNSNITRSINIDKLNVVAIIPIKGEVEYLKDKPLMYYTIDAAKKSKYIKSIIVSTDNIETAKIANSIGAQTPFIRDRTFSEVYIDIVRVYQHSLEQLDLLKKFPDILVTLKITFPFRPPGIIDNMIEQLFNNGLDSIIAAKYENKSIWKEKEGKIELLDEGLTPRQYKDPTFIGLRGLCCVTHPEFLREGSIFGQNIGIYEIDNPVAHFEVRSEKEFIIADKLIDITNDL